MKKAEITVLEIFSDNGVEISEQSPYDSMYLSHPASDQWRCSDLDSIFERLIGCHLIFLTRYQKVVSSYLISLMISAPKHTLTNASIIGGLHKSQYSRLLSGHPELAKESLKELSQAVALEESISLTPLSPGSPWHAAIVIDSTLHGRSTMHTDNAQKFNHGDGFVVGHQWTNIVLLLNDRLIPLPPIEFLSIKKCKSLGIEYRTEHEKIEDYLGSLSLEEWIGACPASKVVVLMDSGYDNSNLQRLITIRGWDLVGALKKSRGTKNSNAQSSKYFRVEQLFKDNRKNSPWQTVSLIRKGKKKPRRFRARQIIGNINGLKSLDVKLVCSERSGGGKRIYLLSTNTNASLLHIARAYSMRWKVELFHKDVKSYLGLEDLGTHDFTSQESHVNWVYVAYLLLGSMECDDKTGIKARQQKILEWKKAQEKKSGLKKILQLNSRVNGKSEVKKYCDDFLANAM